MKVDIVYIDNRTFSNLKSRKIIRAFQHLVSKDLASNNVYINHSIAHSHNYIAVANSFNRVGIDIERINKTKDILRRGLLTFVEKQWADKFGFTAIWTLKESIAKYYKIGLFQINAVEIISIGSQYVTFVFNKDSFCSKTFKIKYRLYLIDVDYTMCLVAEDLSNVYLNYRYI